MVGFEWRKVTGTQTEMPLEIDEKSSPTTVYIRKNIKEAPINQGNEDKVMAWEYDEAKITKEQYEKIGKRGILGEIKMDSTLESMGQFIKKTEEWQLGIMAALADIYENSRNGV